MTKKLVNTAKTLRKILTDAERLLWERLRSRQLNGLKFRRQHPLGKYVVDFACLEARLVIEVDGGQHSMSSRDIKRDEWLALEGFKVLRFWNNEVQTNIEGVLQVIQSNSFSPSPQSPPLKGGEAEKER